MDLGNFINRLTILPRGIIVAIDIVVVIVSAFIGYLLRFNFNIEEVKSFNPLAGVTLISLSFTCALLCTKSYAGIVRYTGIEDGIRLLNTVVIGYILVVLGNLFYYYLYEYNIVPYSVVIISFFISFLFLFYYRLLVKAVFSYYKGDISAKTHVVIFGAGSLGMITRTVLETDPQRRYKIVGFLEEDVHKKGKSIQGVPIYAWSDFDSIVNRYSVKQLIIAVKDLGAEKKNEIFEKCLTRGILVRITPAPDKWFKGELRVSQLKQINIDDLLGREVIQLHSENLFHAFSGKKICITGAAGSIGSELARQLIQFHPYALVLIDQAETPLYELERELRELNPVSKLGVYVGDITNRHRMAGILRSTTPHLIFHAAAYKHVPVMEANPAEAVLTNVLGTRVLADLAVDLQVEKFVMISTDKAVNPTSVMGCSKRIAEIYVQSLIGKLLTQTGDFPQFITTRFGNVLGSNGSVIPIFKKQIEAGGPVTVTHPEITRYFMTIPEACRLVLEAGAMGRGGEIFIFDMGRPVKIADLAKKMIRLSGLEPGKDIDIVFTGLREGEKLHEELLSNEEDTLPTYHPKILKARVREYDFSYVLSMVELLEELVHDKNELKLLALMKEIVPEYNYQLSLISKIDADYLRL